MHGLNVGRKTGPFSLKLTTRWVRINDLKDISSSSTEWAYVCMSHSLGMGNGGKQEWIW